MLNCWPDNDQQQQPSASTSSSPASALTVSLVGSPLGRVQRHLECSVCLELLSDPRQLPCQHTFCHGCLLRLAAAAASDAAAAAAAAGVSRLTGGVAIRCPVCRRAHPVQQSSSAAIGFPRNLLAGCLLDSLAQCCSCDSDTLASNACPGCGRTLCQAHFLRHIDFVGDSLKCGLKSSSTSVAPDAHSAASMPNAPNLRALLTELESECRSLSLGGGGGSLVMSDPSDQQLVSRCAKQLLALLGGQAGSTGGFLGVNGTLLNGLPSPLPGQLQMGIRRKDWLAVRQSGPSQPLMHPCHSEPWDVALVRHTQTLYYCPSASVCNALRRHRPDHSWRRLPRTLLYCSHDNGELELLACGVGGDSDSTVAPLTRVQLGHRQRLALHYQERGELLLLANWQHSRVHVCNLALDCVRLITGLLHPRGLCVDPLRALLYVTNSCVCNLDVYCCDTYRHCRTLRHAEFRDLHSVCCHGDRLFVSDTGANCVFAFSAGDPTRVMQRYRLDCPGFLCVDWEGCLYVACGPGQHTVAVIDSAAEQQQQQQLPLLAMLGCEKSSELGRFRLVRGLACLDHWNCLCVCDFGNRRLQFFYF